MHNFDVSAEEHRDCKLVLGTDCEKVLDAGLSAVSTRAGDLMTACLKYNARAISVNTTTER